MRGGYTDEVIADEFDDMPPQLVPLVIEPMLADRVGALARRRATGCCSRGMTGRG